MLTNRLKRYPEPETGKQAAQKYFLRRKISRSHGSSLKKLQRCLNIAAGLRPLCYGTPENRK